MSAIELKSLTKFYGKHRGIEDLSFAVEEGELFGFIGPNGSGKSTTIRTLLDLIHPTSGSATVLGLDTRREGKRLRAQVGYLPGEVYYYEHMRVRQLLRYSASFYPGDFRQRIQELADEMELDLGRKIGQLSFGGRKKVGIVQALLHQPQVLLLDEPTAGLDPLMQQKFFALLRRENQRGVTVLFSSHVLSEVQRLCSRVAIIRGGRLADLQSVDDLRDRSCCRVRAEGPGMAAEQFSLEGVSDLTVDAHGAEFLYRGNTNRLLETLGRVPMTNLRVDEPDLEEVFLHFYKGGDDR